MMAVPMALEPCLNQLLIQYPDITTQLLAVEADVMQAWSHHR